MDIITIEETFKNSCSNDWRKILIETKETSYIYDEEIKDNERKNTHEKKIIMKKDVEYYVYKKDVNLRLKKSGDPFREKFEEEWACFAHYPAQMYEIQLYYSSSCINNFTLILVDGRCFLPLLDSKSGYKVLPYQAALIINQDDSKTQRYINDALHKIKK
tara:strand:+ start:184 stop:663 length:480 start_codon:yes stop_codon:yes gene_type:complete